MKLKCEDHQRRVLVSDLTGSTLHRSDGSVCPSKYLFMGKSIIAPIELIPRGLSQWHAA